LYPLLMQDPVTLTDLAMQNFDTPFVRKDMEKISASFSGYASPKLVQKPQSADAQQYLKQCLHIQPQEATWWSPGREKVVYRWG